MKKTIKEVIVVEGRDDTAAIKRAIDTDTIETHGFGIKKETWQLIEKAYEERGIIIFTDPDFAGNEIRRKLLDKFPNGKEAFLSKRDAEKEGDIGIENAEPHVILEALSKAHCTVVGKGEEFTMVDLQKCGLVGMDGAREKRDSIGRALGIGYGNTVSFLNKLNKYGITRKEYDEVISTINN